MKGYCANCQGQRELENEQERDLLGMILIFGNCSACGTQISRRPPAAPTCFCGIEIAEATRLCTELDCPYRR